MQIPKCQYEVRLYNTIIAMSSVYNTIVAILVCDKNRTLRYNSHTMNPLREYVLEIMKRHPGLSLRQASIRAGLNENAIQQIVSGARPRPRPGDLKLIADAWGTPQDYYEMMRLAGYEVPLPPDVDNPEDVKVLTLFKTLPEEDRKYVLDILWALNRGEITLETELRKPQVQRIALRASELNERGCQAILDMMEYVRKAQVLENQEQKSQTGDEAEPLTWADEESRE
jgi:transcriptional regulator with XRE-family HTH domain